VSRASSLLCALLACACSEPAFVSLGRNVQSVASSSPDGGSALDVSSAEGACGSAQLVSDDPATPGADLSFGWEIDPQPDPALLPVCELVGESVPIDSACEQRLPLTCPEADGEPARARALLFDVIARCTDLAYRITATFDAGCATAFSIESLEPLVVPSVRACVAARLQTERYDCMQIAGCDKASTYPLPTR
jgi:hypothetical protein